MVRAIVKLHIPSRAVEVEGRYRTEDQQMRAFRRLQGENTSASVAYLIGEMVQITDTLVTTPQETQALQRMIRYCQGWVILPHDVPEILDTASVFVVGNLETFLDRLKANIPHILIDPLIGPLALREHVREAGSLPDGKYIARQKQEADKLAVLSVRECFSYEEVIRRATEVIRDKPHLQTEIAIAIGGWRPKRLEVSNG